MTESKPHKIYCEALNKWGAEAQTLMVFEEMSELQKELCKHARGKDNREAIAEEIADVQIMLEQMMNKQKGWPQCEKCDQWKENKCGTVNEEGLSPCEVMSRKVFNYLVKQED